MNYTHSNPAEQGIAIGNNFCTFHTRNSISCYCPNGESELEITKDSHLRSMTMATLGTQPFVIYPNTFQLDCNKGDKK